MVTSCEMTRVKFSIYSPTAPDPTNDINVVVGSKLPTDRPGDCTVVCWQDHPEVTGAETMGILDVTGEAESVVTVGICDVRSAVRSMIKLRQEYCQSWDKEQSSLPPTYVFVPNKQTLILLLAVMTSILEDAEINVSC